MSVLKNLETKIADLVEGAFGRAFRSELRPVEIARKLAREMEEHRTISVSRTYVPNEYTVYVSAEDRERFADYEDALVAELEGYLLEHSRQERLALLSRPQISLRDRRAPQPRRVRHPGPAGAHRRRPQRRARAGRDGSHDDVQRRAPARGRAGRCARRRPRAGPRTAGAGWSSASTGAVLGRSRDCDIVLDDGNVSRRHAEIVPRDGGWSIVDLGSTNGVTVDGRRVRGSAPLRGGEELELGTTHVRFELE